MIDAMLYVNDNGTKWRALPVEFPDWLAAYRFFRRWRDQEDSPQDAERAIWHAYSFPD
ncbi:transposase [Catenulispora sp. EB89]|uniref:transposase n=1 Tax=Catenulispora sp. EB89 TaxID=3156257 RepID=UPI003511D34A